MIGENDNYDYRTAAEMSLDEQIEISKKALASAIKLSQSNSSDVLIRKIEEIRQSLQNLEKIKSSLGREEAYDAINPDDMYIEEIKQWFYATVRDNLLFRGLSRKEVLLLLEEFKLKKRIEDMTLDQLQKPLVCIADEIYEMKDNIICHRCHCGKIKVFENRGGYSVRCDYCKTTNYCRCSTEEMAIKLWNKGSLRV